jgi:hypothetical protein
VLLVPLCGATIEGMHIGITGAGDLGIALGERLASRRHQVMFGGGESARKVATRGGAKAGTNAAVDRACRRGSVNQPGREAVHEADGSDPDAAKERVVGLKTEDLPAGELQFLMELSIESVAARLGLVTP